MSDAVAAVVAALRFVGLAVDDSGDAVEVSHGRGPRLRSATLDRNLVAHWGTDRADALGFARGAHAVLNEPPRSPAANWGFAEAARCIVPTVERPAYDAGARAVGSGGLFTVPFQSGLSLYFVLELDDGYRALPADQVAGWGATADRVERAAASMLFHRSRDVDFEPASGSVLTLRSGDGFDAARVAVLDALDYDRCRRGCWVGIPSHDTIWVHPASADIAEREAFAEQVRAHFAQTRQPLWPGLIEFVEGKRLGG